MIKTFNINLAGQIFNINEDAYDRLSGYFGTLRNFYKDVEEKDEIIRDIEARFAELFLAKGKNYIVTLTDAEQVIQMMGNPQEFDEETSQQQESSQENTTTFDNSNTSKIGGKRLYRDSENNIIAGVCSGLSAYFGISDAIWIRLAFILFVFIGFGSPFLVYIVLWIIMPEATTPSQKLEMKGEQINLNNIEKKVKDQMNEFTANDDKNKGVLYQLVSLIGKMVKLFFKILLGIGIFVLGCVVIAVMFALFAATFGIGIALIFGTPLAAKFFFDDNSYSWLISIGGLLVSTIPLILVIIGAVHLLSKKSKPFKKQIVLPLVGLFFTGLLLLNISYREGKKLIQEHKKITQNVPINYSTPLDTIELSMAYSDIKGDDLNIRGFREFVSFLSKNQEIHIPVDIEIYPSNFDSVTIVKEFSAQGATGKEALINATSMTHSMHQVNNKFTIDPFLGLNTEKNKFRNQKLIVKIYVPEGKVIKWNERVEDFMDEHNLPINWDAIRNGHRMTTLPPLPSLPPVTLGKGQTMEEAQQKLEEAQRKLEEAHDRLEREQERMMDSLDDDISNRITREHYIFRMENGQLVAID